MLFRLHRGVLTEAMKTVKEFTSLPDLLNYIKEDVAWLIFEEITFTYQCFDKRIEWDSYIVCAITPDGEFPVGYSNSNTFN